MFLGGEVVLFYSLTRLRDFFVERIHGFFFEVA